MYTSDTRKLADNHCTCFRVNVHQNGFANRPVDRYIPVAMTAIHAFDDFSVVIQNKTHQRSSDDTVHIAHKHTHSAQTVFFLLRPGDVICR